MRQRLVIDPDGPEPVLVFLPNYPDADGPPGTEVTLWPLPDPGGPRYLGRSVWHRTSYREFRSEIELLLVGHEPAGEYRVCDSWAEYLDPWGSYVMNEQPTERMGCPCG
ncbi:MAG TPA: hypothetical protein VM597_08855 [Gemmataceae bacterium]|nr:hypothetical protein [Gemmataceae bacterium]